MTVSGRRRVFIDEDLEATLIERGWVLIDLLPTTVTTQLRSRLESLVGGPHEGLVFSNQIRDVADRRSAEAAIAEVAGPPFLALLDGYRLAASLFVLKLPGPAGRRIWHADPAIVDERHATSVSAWIPLVDVDEHNGAFVVCEGSHQVVPPVRGGVEVQGLLFPSETEVEAMCSGARRSISMRAGQALVYDHRLAHGSPPNRSDGARWALNVPAVPEEVPLVHFIREADGSIDVYELPDRYFYGHDAAIPVRADPTVRRTATIDPESGEWRAPAEREHHEAGDAASQPPGRRRRRPWFWLRDL